MPRLFSLLTLLGGFCALNGILPAAESTSPVKPHPNVLLIILDDENAYAGRTNVAPQPVTPNLDRLARRGVTFANAQCAAPVCNPSRTAIMSGLRPSTSGIYDNDQDAMPKDHLLQRATALPIYFREHGYKVAGSGKIFGSSFGTIVKHRVWDETMETGRKGRGEDAKPPKEKIPLNGFGKHDWGGYPDRREQMSDWQMAGWAADFLSKPQTKPFFLACGIVKPHTPWYVPKEYFDLFPPDQINIPDLAANESAGVPAVMQVKPKQIKQEAPMVARRKEMVAAYFAASRYADDCTGRILDALEKSAYRNNTIVIIFGDNGYQFGEKNHWSKGGLWEGSAHVPLVMAGPGIVSGETTTRPVSLVDLYPTLLELAGLPAKSGLEGASLVPLLKNPAAPWEIPALTTKGFKNHALRTEQWRYIRYADGSEELYDHVADPLEQRNVATKPESAAVKAGLQKWFPKTNAPRYPNSSGAKNVDN